MTSNQNQELDWNNFYLGMAQYISWKSKDPSTQTGAVIVRPDMTVASVGYNGFPRAMPDEPEAYQDREQKYSRIIHCEMNALMMARESVENYVLYTYPFMSCDRCFVHMVQAGIKTFVYPKATEEQLSRWGASFAKTLGYAAECGVKMVEIDYESPMCRNFKLRSVTH